jgi:hypothetical protein
MTCRFFVGLASGARSIFTSDALPTAESHGHPFGAVIGPFRTKRAAVFTRDFGANNPHCRSVADAERLASNHASGLLTP